MKVRATTASGPDLGGAPITGSASTYRQRLGEVIAWCIKERGRTTRDISRRCGVSIGVAEQWLAGALVPKGAEWHRLVASVARELGKYQPLYVEARTEEIKERESLTRSTDMMTNGRNGTPPPATVATNLGDKMRSVQVQPQLIPRVTTAQLQVERAPEPERQAPTGDAAPVQASDANRTPSGRRPMPTKPPGAMSDEQRTKRADFVRRTLRDRPHAKLGGPDGIVTLVRNTFGVGISPTLVEDIRAEVLAELRQRAGAPVPPVPTKPFSGLEGITAPAPRMTFAEATERALETLPPAPSTPATSTADTEQDITAALQLLRDSIPGLQRMVIDVDADGEISVDYQIREVKVTTIGGTLKVRR